MVRKWARGYHTFSPLPIFTQQRTDHMMIRPIEQQHKVREAQAHSVPAKRLKEKLEVIPSQYAQLERRWFWELLQNAHDVATEQGVSVKLTIHPDQVVFEHDGRPFKPMEAENLIKPDSDKDDVEYERKRIGQFGTGFISTHILSASVRVDGCIRYDEVEGAPINRFSIPLDRTEIGNKEYLIESIKRSESEFDASLSQIDLPSPSTRFTYDLSRPIKDIDVHQAVENGLQHVRKILPYVLALMHEKVRSVVIEDLRPGSTIPYELFTIQPTVEGQFIFERRTTSDDPAPQRQTVWCTSKYGVTLTSLSSEGQLVPYPVDLPRLFYFLPLIGSEDFPSPVIIHSTDLKPTHERTGIMLSDKDHANRQVMLAVSKVMSDHLARLTGAGLKGLHQMSHWPKGRLSQSEHDWIKPAVHEPWGEVILNAKLVRALGDLKALKDTRIPRVSDASGAEQNLRELEDILRACNWFTLPDSDEIADWVRASSAIWGKEVVLRAGVLVQRVAEFGSLDKLTEKDLNNDWLARVIRFVLRDQPSLLEEHAIIPDGTGVFRKRSVPLQWNKGLSEELIGIHHDLTGQHYLAKTFHDCVNALVDLRPAEAALGDDDLCQAIDTAFHKVHEDRGSKLEAHEMEALQAMFRWVDSNKEQAKKCCDWFWRHQASLFMHTFNAAQKDHAFAIVRSGKSEALSKLADSSISAADLDFLAQNPIAVSRVLQFIREHQDDETFADEHTGDIGESIIYEHLKQRFPSPEHEVRWASKEGEARFDFEVKRSGDTILYVDAKTTKSGMANTDSVPFFVRKAQWEFLEDQRAKDRYEIGRVFLGGNSMQVKWLSLGMADPS